MRAILLVNNGSALSFALAELRRRIPYTLSETNDRGQGAAATLRLIDSVCERSYTLSDSESMYIHSAEIHCKPVKASFPNNWLYDRGMRKVAIQCK